VLLLWVGGRWVWWLAFFVPGFREDYWGCTWRGDGSVSFACEGVFEVWCLLGSQRVSFFGWACLGHMFCGSKCSLNSEVGFWLGCLFVGLGVWFGIWCEWWFGGFMCFCFWLGSVFFCCSFFLFWFLSLGFCSFFWVFFFFFFTILGQLPLNPPYLVFLQQ